MTTTQNGHDRLLSQAEPNQVEDAEELSLVPPHSTQAEEAMLGSVLKNGLAIADVLTFLKPHHFYERRHEYIYAAMGALFERAAAIDYHTIAEELTHQGTYDACWRPGVPVRAQLDDAVSSTHRALRPHRARARGASALHQRWPPTGLKARFESIEFSRPIMGSSSATRPAATTDRVGPWRAAGLRRH